MAWELFSTARSGTLPRRTPEELSARLALLDDAPGVVPDTARRAAVALLLRFDGTDAEVLLLKRAEREGDRWSGHIGLPGGHAVAADADLFATALRETREEVGIDLKRAARPLGRLERIEAKPRGPFVPLWIDPFVFSALSPVTPRAGPEVVETFWFPLERARSGELSSTHVYRREEHELVRPCWCFEGHVVWGLTYEILSRLLRATG